MDKNFDDDIRDMLNNPPEFIPGAFDFAALQGRLDADAAAPAADALESNRDGRGVFWICALLLLALLSGAVWSFMQINAAKNQVKDLEQQLAEKNASEAAIIREMITVYDTVFQTVTVLQENPVVSSSYDDSNFEQAFSNFVDNSQTTNVSALSKENINTAPTETLFDKNNVPRILPLTLKALLATSQDNPLNTSVSTAAEPLRNKKGINLWAAVRPRSVQIGAVFNPWNRFIINGRVRKSSSKGVGLDFNYGRNWRISTGLEYFKVYQELDAMNDDISYYPIAKSDDRRDVLEEVSLDAQFLQIPLGVKYVFMPKKFLRPYLHASVLARRVLRQNFSYTYAERFNPHFLHREFNFSPFLFSGFRFGTGVEFDMYSRLSARIEGTYGRDFTDAAYQYDPLIYWGVKGGLFFEF